MAARVRAPGVGGIVLGLHTHWHVGGPVDLLTGVVTVTGVPAAVEDGLLPTVSTLSRERSFSITRNIGARTKVMGRKNFQESLTQYVCR